MLGGGALRASPTEGCERQGGSRKYVRDANVASETRPYGRERREGKYKGKGNGDDNVKTRALCSRGEACGTFNFNCANQVQRQAHGPKSHAPVTSLTVLADIPD